MLLRERPVGGGLCPLTARVSVLLDVPDRVLLVQLLIRDDLVLAEAPVGQLPPGELQRRVGVHVHQPELRPGGEVRTEAIGSLSVYQVGCSLLDEVRLHRPFINESMTPFHDVESIASSYLALDGVPESLRGIWVEQLEAPVGVGGHGDVVVDVASHLHAKHIHP